MASDSDNIDSLLKKSKGTDIPILLRAKEQAKNWSMTILQQRILPLSAQQQPCWKTRRML